MSDLPSSIENFCGKKMDRGLVDAALDCADELLRVGLIPGWTTFDVVDYGTDGVFLFPKSKRHPDGSPELFEGLRQLAGDRRGGNERPSSLRRWRKWRP